MVMLTFFSLVQTEAVPRGLQQPITNFTRPWDDFMVHGVNIPSISREFLLENWSYSQCFQLQLDACYDLSILLNYIELYSLDSSMIIIIMKT